MRGQSMIALGLIGSASILGCNSEGAATDFEERFIQACSTRSNMHEELCECMAGLAAEEITADAQALLLAILEDDQDAAAELRTKIPVQDAMQAGMFMTEAARCAPPGQ